MPHAAQTNPSALSSSKKYSQQHTHTQKNPEKNVQNPDRCHSATRPQGRHRKSRGRGKTTTPPSLPPFLLDTSPRFAASAPPPPPPPPPRRRRRCRGRRRSPPPPPPPRSARPPSSVSLASPLLRSAPSLLVQLGTPEIRHRRPVWESIAAKSALQRIIVYYGRCNPFLLTFVVSTSLSCLAIQPLGLKDA